MYAVGGTHAVSVMISSVLHPLIISGASNIGNLVKLPDDDIDI